MRVCGAPIARDRLKSEATFTGDLRVEELRDEALGRSLRFVRLAGLLPKDEKAVRPLNDCTLLWMGTEAFVLAGHERISDADYAQG